MDTGCRLSGYVLSLLLKHLFLRNLSSQKAYVMNHAVGLLPQFISQGLPVLILCLGPQNLPNIVLVFIKCIISFSIFQKPVHAPHQHLPLAAYCLSAHETAGPLVRADIVADLIWR